MSIAIIFLILSSQFFVFSVKYRSLVLYFILGMICGVLVGIKIFVIPYLLLLLFSIVLFAPALFPNYKPSRILKSALLIVIGTVTTGILYYSNAFLRTGNPIFPFYNSLFKSPYFQSYNFKDANWATSLKLNWLSDVVINSSSYMESSWGYITPLTSLLVFFATIFLITSIYLASVDNL